MLCLEVSDVHGLPFFSVVGVLPPDLLQHGDLHVRHAVAWQVEVGAGGLVQVLVGDVAAVLSEPVSDCLLGLANVLLSAPLTLENVDHILCMTVIVLL